MSEAGSAEGRGWRGVLHEVIFEADTPAGKAFDVVLVLSILLSVAVVMLESVEAVGGPYRSWCVGAEWFFTILFSVEYVLRLSCVGRPLCYARSFYGVIDLLAVLPTYVGLVFPGTHYLTVVRVLRVLRIFRVLKLMQYVRESDLILQALRASRRKIVVFVFAVLTLVVIMGSLMYVVEGKEHGFTSIPRSAYWAIVTLTTVGYGDISPETALGQTIAALVMIMGYAIIAIPTGIVTVELANASKKKLTTQSCPECSSEGHDHDAKHCKFCGGEL